MVVLHQLEHKGIPLEVFISHEVFTSPQLPHQPNFSSSSTQVSSPQENLPSSPSLDASNEEGSGNDELSENEGDNDNESNQNEEGESDNKSFQSEEEVDDEE